MRQQINFPWWFLIIILAAFAVGYYAWSESLEEPNLESGITNYGQGPDNSAPSEVEGWQTYRNEEYGFEVRYPKEWRKYDFPSTVPEGKNLLTIASFELKEMYYDYQRGEIEVNFFQFYEKGSDLKSFVNKWGEPLDETEAVERMVKTHNSYVGTFLTEGSEIAKDDIIYKNENVQIQNNINAIRQTLGCKKPCVGLGVATVKNISYFFQYKGVFYRIWASTRIDDTHSEEIFNQILSTFRFINSTNAGSSESKDTTVNSGPKVVALKDLATNSDSFLGMTIQVSGTLINQSNSYYKNAHFALTENGYTFEVTSWVPLEVPAPMLGSSADQPVTMKTYLNKSVTLVGIVRKTDRFYLEVNSGEINN